MRNDGPSYNQVAGQKTQRIEALSDGVFAIALTLLVLDIKVPVSDAFKTEADLMAALCALMPKFLSYFLSFMTLGIFWTGHTTQFSFIEKSDRHLNWISLFFLLFVSILPFTTAFLSEHINFKLSIGIYWFNILALGAGIYIHWWYACKNDYLSITGEEKNTINKAIRKRVIVAQALYAIGALLCFISNYLSITFIIVVQLNYAIAPRFTRKRKK